MLELVACFSSNAALCTGSYKITTKFNRRNDFLKNGFICHIIGKYTKGPTVSLQRCPQINCEEGITLCIAEVSCTESAKPSTSLE